MRYVTIRKFSSESGYTENAVRTKIRDGVWRLGQVWRKAPDGRVLIDVLGYEAWVESGKKPEIWPMLKVGRSPSPLKGAKVRPGGLPPLTK